MNAPQRCTTGPVKDRHGYSMLELLVVLAIVGILTSIAAPALQGYVNRSRANSALNRISSDVAYARVYAVRESRRVLVQIANDGSYTIDTLNATGTPVPLRRVDLRTDYPNISTEGSTLGSLQFNARGLTPGGTAGQMVVVRAGDAADSLLVSPTGRTYRP